MRWSLAVLVALSACVPRAVNERITALESRVAELEGAGIAPLMPSGQEPQAARELLAQAQQAVAEWRVDDARQALASLLTRYPQSRLTSQATQMRDELAVVGQPAGDLSAVTQWIQGDGSLSTGRIFVVFFEQWCPHCRRHVPQAAELLAGRDASAVLLTRLSRDTSLDTMRSFIAEHDIALPVAHETGTIAERFAVRGVPAAAIVHDGVIVWRGHPASLKGEVLDSLLPRL